jgi:peptide/nickel transport system ATP-binding protein
VSEPSSCLQARDLVIEYGSASRNAKGRGVVRAVDDFSLELAAGEFVALVGESGSGKSSIANAIFGLAPITAGSLLVDGIDLAGLKGSRARRARRRAQLIMQDPYEALDPHLTVASIVEEPLIVHKLERARERRLERVSEVLESVGLSPASRFLERRPHELSGGQRQRVCIAACLILSPRVLVADEPVSMLDVSVRAGVLHLLDGLRETLDAAVLMITHDLPTAAAFCDRIVVMNDGRIVEQGAARAVVEHPQHAYTRELLDATPTLTRGAPTPEPS